MIDFKLFFNFLLIRILLRANKHNIGTPINEYNQYWLTSIG